MGGRWILENDDNRNSLESLFSITRLWYCSWSAARRLHAHRMVSSHHRHVLQTLSVTPGCRRVICQFSAVTAAPEDLFHVVISFDYVLCPAPDLAHSFSSSGKELEQRRQKNGKAGVQAVICDLVFLGNQRNVTWFQLTENKKVLSLFDFTPSILYLSF